MDGEKLPKVIVDIDGEIKRIDDVIAKGVYKDNWESLSAYPVPLWYKNAKFGIFIHWGAYTVPAYFSEWYIRLMYYKCNPVYWHHNRVYGKKYSYRNFINEFTAPNFNASEWISLCKNAGAKYVMPVAEHHDGYKMYDSELSRWTSVKQALKRDIIGELKGECDKQSVVFATSSHRAEHFWFVNGAKTVGFDNEALREEYSDLYGDLANVNKRNNLITLLKQEKGIVPTAEWLKDWLVHSAELIDKYQPSTLFFDWWVMNHAFRPYMKKFLAYYYNRSLEWGKEVCVQYKSDAIMYNTGIFDRERGQLESTSPYIWQSETSTAYNSWSYCTTNKYKSSAEIAAVFADVISKNGNFVLNIGPKADGTIADEEKRILSDLGEWTTKNSDAIWGTTPYKVYGEGVKRKGGSFKERMRYKSTDYRYTFKTCHLYAFALAPKGRAKFKLKELAVTRDKCNFIIKSIKILGYDNLVEFKSDRNCLTIYLDRAIETDMPICFDIAID